MHAILNATNEEKEERKNLKRKPDRLALNSSSHGDKMQKGNEKKRK